MPCLRKIDFALAGSHSAVISVHYCTLNRFQRKDFSIPWARISAKDWGAELTSEGEELTAQLIRTAVYGYAGTVVCGGR
jgi:hypothetical protein